MTVDAGPAEVDLVMPVYNEGANVGRALEEIYAKVPLSKRVLIVYDFDEDNTVPVVRALASQYPGVELVKNTIGKGVLNAVRAGVAAASAEVVVITMADLSDDVAVIPKMVALIRDNGYDIVCASRYMRGGRQIGGPVLKKLMSRAAGVSLHWLSGLPSHDATNAFRAYRRSVLVETPIESRGGFEYSLEITAKAFAAGRRITEVPSVWRDRSAGESRFKLRAWLPLYLHWYVFTLTHPPRPPRLRRDFFWALACALMGLILSTLPHAIWYAKRGEPVWFSDYDDILYTSFAAKAYVHHPFAMADPVYPDKVPTHYPWLQFIPGELIAHAFGMGPLLINLAWRGLSGVFIGAGWYALLRTFRLRPAIAGALTALLLSDGGLVAGLPVFRNLWTAIGLVSGRSVSQSLGTIPLLCFQWRIITPALSLPFLIAQVALLARAREAPRWSRLLLSGFGFGLLFYVYFYFWTAVGLALVIAWALDAGHRRVYVATGLIGGLIGLPGLILNAKTRASGITWTERGDYFVHVPRLESFQLHWSLILIAVCLPWVWRTRKDLLYLWSLAATAALLVNHQVVSGLEIQNFHWMYVRGPALGLLILLLVWTETRRLHAVGRLLAAVVLVVLAVGQMGLGLALRSVEAVASHSVKEIMPNLDLYEAQRLRAGVLQLVGNSVVAGDPTFLDFAAIAEDSRPLIHPAVLYSSATDNSEWDARLALNAFLLGQDRGEFESTERAFLTNPDQRHVSHGGAFGPWRRNKDARDDRMKRRLAAYDQITADPVASLRRFSVRYLAEPVTSPSLSPAKRPGWHLKQAGPTWNVWERDPSDDPIVAN